MLERTLTSPDLRSAYFGECITSRVICSTESQEILTIKWSGALGVSYMCLRNVMKYKDDVGVVLVSDN